MLRLIALSTYSFARRVAFSSLFNRLHIASKKKQWIWARCRLFASISCNIELSFKISLSWWTVELLNISNAQTSRELSVSILLDGISAVASMDFRKLSLERSILGYRVILNFVLYAKALNLSSSNLSAKVIDRVLYVLDKSIKLNAR